MKQKSNCIGFFSLLLSVFSVVHSSCTVQDIDGWLKERNGFVSTLREQRNPSFEKLGDHIIAEFMGCQNLHAPERLEELLLKATKAAHATPLGVETHAFSPQGMSGIVLLQESHISVHTWPECDYVAIDIFTCGSDVFIDDALAVLLEFFTPRKVRVVKIDRGIDDAE